MSFSFSPKYINCKLQITLNEQVYDLGSQLIHDQGMPGIAWSKFDPKKFVGSEVMVEATSIDNPNLSFKCTGYVSSETTEKSTQLGLIFSTSNDQKASIKIQIEKTGTSPDYVRKFPRIQFDKRVTVMPELALIHFITADAQSVSAMGFVDNISPTGISIKTEDIRVAQLNLNDPITCILQPRGRQKAPIETLCSIKRLIVGTEIYSLNKTWTLGMSVVTMGDAEKAAFADILRAIISELRAPKAAA